MVPQKNNQRMFIIGAAVLGIILLIIAIVAIYTSLNKNKYGDSISIANYDTLIKHLSDDYKKSITANLYQMVDYNAPNRDVAKQVRDAKIRESSVIQDEHESNIQYSGSFLVDIASIKQTYFIQYEYSLKPNDGFVSGYPIMVSCPQKSQLTFGDFNCKDLYVTSEQDTISDPIIYKLPATTLSYKIYADASSDTLLIKVQLRIPESDLAGSTASKQQVVAMYKQEVVSWFKKNNFDMSAYTILYNYDDSGNPIGL